MADMVFFDYRVKRKKRKWYLAPIVLDRTHMRRTARHRKYHSRSRRRLVRGILACIAVCLVLAGAGVAGIAVLRESGRRNLTMEAAGMAPSFGERQDVSGMVSRNGKWYQYEEQAINILCMGIDRNTSLEQRQEIGESGQADTIVLMSLNPEAGTVRAVGISRDTMTRVRMYDRQGNAAGKAVNHLGLAYSYGDGAKKSCELMTEAVSELFYGLPIHGYVSVNLNAIQKLNDAVGGVPVTLQEDMRLDGVEYPAGTELWLTGNEAEGFVRTRDMEQEDSNIRRMERQKQYAVAFLRTAADTIRQRPSTVVELYDALAEDMVTGIGVSEAVYLGSLLPELQFSVEDIQMMPGTVKQGAVYEEFYPDEEALQDMILEFFYRDSEEGGLEAQKSAAQAVDFEHWQEINPEIYAWITVPGTGIDAPVVQSIADNGYYLDHGSDGQKSSKGAIFSEDYNQKDFSDVHTVLYGKAPEDGTGFAGLHQFGDESFFRSHPTIVITTPEAVRYYRIFAAYLYDNRHLLQTYDCENPDIFEQYIKQVKEQKNLYVQINQEVQVEPGDHILTLSTGHSKGAEYRYLVQAVLERTEEAGT